MLFPSPGPSYPQPNPRNPRWSPMKLYKNEELAERALRYHTLRLEP